MIQLMARHGYNPDPRLPKFEADADVKRFFISLRMDYDSLVENCRLLDEPVPFLENLVGASWHLSGGEATIVNMESGEKETKVESPAILIISTYQSLFEDAARHFRNCLRDISVGDFQSCVTSGIASSEAYISHRAIIYNATSTDGPQLEDNKQKKVAFDVKVDEWIPVMSGGKRLNKGGTRWSHFRQLQRMRDDLAIHPKKPQFGVSYTELCEWLNLFRGGIAGLLVELHLLFGENIPCRIIRYAYLPPVEVVEMQEG